MQDAHRYRRADEPALQGEYIPYEQTRDSAHPPHQPCPFRERKQQVLNAVVERMRAEAAVKHYRELHKNRAAPIKVLRDYA